MIAPAQVADVSALMALERDGFEPSGQWGASSWLEEIGRDGHLALVHRQGGVTDAAIACSVAGDVADLLRVVVAPQARRGGVGASLVRAGLEWMAAQGAVRAMLEVRDDNAAALGLYRAFGFGVIATRADYYGPGADALVMGLELPRAGAAEAGGAETGAAEVGAVEAGADGRERDE